MCISDAESLTDHEIVDCINDNTNESQQGEIWEYCINDNTNESQQGEIWEYCINDNTNESQQGEIWESTKPAVLSFEGVFSNISKYILFFANEPSHLLKKLLF